MHVLVDSNILLRMCQPAHPQQQPAIDALTALRGRGHTICIVPQNLYEFWVVATRPTAANGLDRTPGQAASLLIALRHQFLLLPEVTDVLYHWERLVLTFGVSGKQAHDARLVAAAMAHGIGHLLTFNAADFQRFPAVTVHTPDTVAQAPP